MGCGLMVNDSKGKGWFILELYTPIQFNGDSILNSVKKYLGMTEDYTHFDLDLIIHINSVFMILNQLGIGPVNGFEIENELATWDEFVNNNEYIDDIKNYVCLRVRLLFDPPSGFTVMESINRTINRLEWNLVSMSEQ